MKVYLVDDTKRRILAPTRDKAHDMALHGYKPFIVADGEVQDPSPLFFVRSDVQIIELDLSTDKDFLLLLINEGPDVLGHDYPHATKRRTWELTQRGGLKLISDYREGA